MIRTNFIQKLNNLLPKHKYKSDSKLSDWLTILINKLTNNIIRSDKGLMLMINILKG